MSRRWFCSSRPHASCKNISNSSLDGKHEESDTELTASRSRNGRQQCNFSCRISTANARGLAECVALGARGYVSWRRKSSKYREQWCRRLNEDWDQTSIIKVTEDGAPNNAHVGNRVPACNYSLLLFQLFFRAMLFFPLSYILFLIFSFLLQKKRHIDTRQNLWDLYFWLFNMHG